MVEKGEFHLETLDYYNKNAKNYFDNTVELNLQEALDKFIEYLPDNAEILDLGCGSGRDSLYFIKQGFCVTAIDGSKELSKLASIHIGQDVLQMQFSELDFDEVFDGVWACASLLHNTKTELDDVLQRIEKALKPGGILYMSFQYGEFSGDRNGRYFLDFRTKDMKNFVSKYNNLIITDIWKSSDVREDRKDEIWLNVIIKKTDS